MQRWQTTGLDSAFGIRQADYAPAAGVPGLDPFGRDGLSTGRKVRMVRCLPACCEANRHQPVFPPVHFGFRTGCPRPLRRRGRRQDASGPSSLAVEMDGPRQVYALSGYAARDPVTVAGELHAICGRSEGMSVRGRTMARGGRRLPQGGDLRRRLHGQGMDAGGRPEVGGPGTRQPRPLAGAAARGREWTMGSHSPDPRRAAGRCSSRERGDGPGDLRAAPAQGGRRTERRRAAPGHSGGGARAGNPDRGDADRPPDIPFC